MMIETNRGMCRSTTTVYHWIPRNLLTDWSVKVSLSLICNNDNVLDFFGHIWANYQALYRSRDKKNIQIWIEIGLKGPFSSSMFCIDLDWNQLGPCRSSLDTCFINTVCLYIWPIYSVYLNRWTTSNRRFKHFTLERKTHTSAKFKGCVKQFPVE